MCSETGDQGVAREKKVAWRFWEGWSTATPKREKESDSFVCTTKLQML